MNFKKDQNPTTQGTEIKETPKQPIHQVQQQKPVSTNLMQHYVANKQQHQQKPTTQHPANTKIQTKQQQQAQLAKPQQQLQSQQFQQIVPKKIEPQRSIKLLAILDARQNR